MESAKQYRGTSGVSATVVQKLFVLRIVADRDVKNTASTHALQFSNWVVTWVALSSASVYKMWAQRIPRQKMATRKCHRPEKVSERLAIIREVLSKTQ